MAWAIPAEWHWSPAPAELDSAWLRSPVDWLATCPAGAGPGRAAVRPGRHADVWRGAPAPDAPTGSRCGSGRPRRRPAPWWASCWSRTPRFCSGVVRAPDSHGLTFGVYPFDPWRLVLVVGLLCANAAALWLAVAVLRLAASWWRVRRAGYGRRLAMGAVFVAAALVGGGPDGIGSAGAASAGAAATAGAGVGGHRGVALDPPPLSARLAGRASHGGVSRPRVADRRAVSRAGQRRAGCRRAHHRRRVRARGAESPRRAACAAQPIA